jgi:transposase InsO family protein
MLAAFPFVIKGFHSDNGSEYINKHVCKLSEKLHIELTKSRSRHSNNNALAESKNASIVRKQFGYQYIAQKWAPLMNEFNLKYLYPYINYQLSIINYQLSIINYQLSIITDLAFSLR